MPNRARAAYRELSGGIAPQAVNEIEGTVSRHRARERARLCPPCEAERRRWPAEIVNRESKKLVGLRLRKMTQRERMNLMRPCQLREQRQPRRHHLIAAARMKAAGDHDRDLHRPVARLLVNQRLVLRHGSVRNRLPPQHALVLCADPGPLVGQVDRGDPSHRGGELVGVARLPSFAGSRRRSLETTECP